MTKDRSTRHHLVLLHEKPIGAIHHTDDVARFVFDQDYWQNPERDVLGLWFDDNPKESPQAALRLPAWFSNLLPEGRLREWIARDRGVNVDREMQLLLQVGRDLPGAVQVIEDGASPKGLADKHPLVIKDDAREPEWKFSLAGVGLKFSMLRRSDRLTIPMSGELGDWIVKLPDFEHPFVPRNEFGMMQMARALGISVPLTILVHRDELPRLPENAWPSAEAFAYAVERFDRAATRRIHIEDFAQVRGFYPGAKYDGSFETIAALAYRSGDESALLEFSRRLAFNCLIGNGDAHLKNWSLIYPDGKKAQLSPAYDLVSTAPYTEHQGRTEDLGLKFGGSRRFEDVSRARFDRLEQKLLGSHGRLSAEVEKVVRDFPDALGALNDSKLSFVSSWISSHATATSARLLG